MSATRKIKTELRSAIRTGFADRGWRAIPGDRWTFQAPESLVPPPLVLRAPVTIESNKFGDTTLTGNVKIQADEVTDLLVRFDRAAMPSQFSHFPGDEMARGLLMLEIQTAGGLLDPDANFRAWTVEAADDIGTVTAEFFEMMDGPLTTWAAKRRTPEKLLELYEHEYAEIPFLRSSAAARTGATLALLHHQPRLARSLIAGYTPGGGDPEARIRLFERLLADRFPEYGSLQRV